MVLNFKIDKDDKLWFLWCSSIRCEGKKVKMMKNDYELNN
jgi:hypothetical protein